jgi:hypothetical protein
MLNYLNKKLELVLDSILEPVWKWLLGTSIKWKIIILVVAISISWLITNPEISRNLFTNGKNIVKVSLSDSDTIPLNGALIEKLETVAHRLEGTIKLDLENLKSKDMTPWIAAQALTSMADRKNDLNLDSVKTYIRSHTAPNCACWTEIPAKKADHRCVFISGWIVSAFSHAGIAAAPGELAYILDMQSGDGWWPTFEAANSEQFASTYSTAWLMLGLISQREQGLIRKTDLERVNRAIEKANSWLMSQRKNGSKWPAYPNLKKNTDSQSISGLTLHALYRAAPGQAASLADDWITHLPEKPPAAGDGEMYYVEMYDASPPAFDHFVQIKLPWMLIASVDAYQSASLLQKMVLLNWIEESVGQESVIKADTTDQNWWRSELLYALKYLKQHSRPIW